MLIKKTNSPLLQFVLETMFKRLLLLCTSFALQTRNTSVKIITCHFQPEGQMHLDANENNLQFWSLANEMVKCKYRVKKKLKHFYCDQTRNLIWKTNRQLFVRFWLLRLNEITWTREEWRGSCVVCQIKQPGRIIIISSLFFFHHEGKIKHKSSAANPQRDLSVDGQLRLLSLWS